MKPSQMLHKTKCAGLLQVILLPFTSLNPLKLNVSVWDYARKDNGQNVLSVDGSYISAPGNP